MSAASDKAKQTRSLKKKAMRNRIYDAVENSHVPKTDWQYAYDLRLNLPDVRHTFAEDERFATLMRQGKIAIPARTLALPKWAKVWLTADEQERLPRVASEHRLPRESLPVPTTGDNAFDADMDHVEHTVIDLARHVSPKKARAVIEENRLVISRMIDSSAEKDEDNRQLRQVAEARGDKLERLERENTRLNRKVERLESQRPLSLPPPSPPSDEARQLQ